MDIPFLIGTVAVLGIVFLVLSAWQRSIEKSQREKALAELRDSHERGTHRPVGQYPQIKPYLCIGCGSCVRACPEDGVLGLVNGIAHVINGSHCVGHARCEEVCPVGAIIVGLGDLKSRPDIPVLTAELETTVPNVFIAGELGGMALIRHAVDQGRRTVDAISKRLSSSPSRGNGTSLDLLIVGAGPAGLAASLRAQQNRLKYRTISQDDVGGTIRKYPRRKLALVQEVEIPLHGRLRGREYSKEELVALWDELIHRHALPVETGCQLTGLAHREGRLEAQTSGGLIAARFVILALGRRGTPRKLGIPGEELDKVVYQLVDAATYTGQKILIVGGGDSAIEAATGLANQAGNVVHLSYRKGDFARLKARNEERIRTYQEQKRLEVVFNSRVKAITPKSVMLAVESPGGGRDMVLPNDYVFIFAGGDPPFSLLKSMGVCFGGDSEEILDGHARLG